MNPKATAATISFQVVAAVAIIAKIGIGLSQGCFIFLKEK